MEFVSTSHLPILLSALLGFLFPQNQHDQHNVLPEIGFVWPIHSRAAEVDAGFAASKGRHFRGTPLMKVIDGFPVPVFPEEELQQFAQRGGGHWYRQISVRATGPTHSDTWSICFWGRKRHTYSA